MWISLLPLIPFDMKKQTNLAPLHFMALDRQTILLGEKKKEIISDY